MATPEMVASNMNFDLVNFISSNGTDSNGALQKQSIDQEPLLEIKIPNQSSCWNATISGVCHIRLLIANYFGAEIFLELQLFLDDFSHQNSKTSTKLILHARPLEINNHSSMLRAVHREVFLHIGSEL